MLTIFNKNTAFQAFYAAFTLHSFDDQERNLRLNETTDNNKNLK